MKHLQTEFFAKNRSRVSELTSENYYFVAAHVRVQKSRDIGFPFTQNSDFYYLTGLSREANAILAVSPKGASVLFVTPRSDLTAQWSGQQSFEELKKVSGISDIRSTEDFDAYLQDTVSRETVVYSNYAFDAFIKHHDMYRNPGNRLLQEKLRNYTDNVRDLRKVLTAMRMVKQAPELAALQEANAITKKSITSIKNTAFKFTHERQLQYALESKFYELGADGIAFDSIVAGGVNSCTIHYEDNASSLQDASLVLLDVGATVDGYCSDVSRVIPYGEGLTERQQEVLDAALDVQKYAKSLLGPGVLWAEYERDVAFYMRQKLSELGLMKLEDDMQRVRDFFPHATSHHLGLDTHDVFDREAPFAADMVLTIEPSIIIPKEGFGVRVEDDVITDSGCMDISKWSDVKDGS